jgi:glycolate oxidase FAD binding subunit
MSSLAEASLARLEQISGSEAMLTDAALLAAYHVDGMRPAAAVRPVDAAAVAAIVRFAAAENLALIACGGRTKLGIGAPPARYDVALDLSRMDRILAYDPGDLTLGVEPGVALADLRRALAEHDQFLPLESPHAANATVGGTIAANAISPLRQAFGGPRDFVLGMEFVTGAGESAKAGGRVVKNVTGYDLHKLLIGSLGTLGILTRINFRTFPRPAEERGFLAKFSSAESALSFCRAITHSPLEPRRLEIFDPAAMQLLGVGSGAPISIQDSWCVLVDAAGTPAVVGRHQRDLERMACAIGTTQFTALEAREREVWLTRALEFPRYVAERSQEAVLLRIAASPTAMPALVAESRRIAQRHPIECALLLPATGMASLALLPRESGSAAHSALAAAVTQFFEAISGNAVNARDVAAMVEGCPAELKHKIALWGPPREDFELMQRVKNVFDPRNILSPGRFCGGV